MFFSGCHPFYNGYHTHKVRIFIAQHNISNEISSGIPDSFFILSCDITHMFRTPWMVTTGLFFKTLFPSADCRKELTGREGKVPNLEGQNDQVEVFIRIEFKWSN